MEPEPEPETPVDIRRLVDLHHTFAEESCNSDGHTRSNSFPWGFTLSPRVAELAEDWLAERESFSPRLVAGGSSPEAVQPKRQKVHNDHDDQQRPASDQAADTMPATSDQHSQPGDKGTGGIDEAGRLQSSTVQSTPSEHHSRPPNLATGAMSVRQKQLEALRQQCNHVSSVNSRLKVCVRTLLAKLEPLSASSSHTGGKSASFAAAMGLLPQ
ncbi:hypothetical protein WJX73_005018 [Symbiochloris irregularis]|uniref:Uncharacterized protein n=1 Tax=Symbiochloris irregularis TaxID=706552 RepID=A0AAW1NX88_9CHLO